MSGLSNNLLYPLASGAFFVGVKSIPKDSEIPYESLGADGVKDGLMQAVATGAAPMAMDQVRKFGLNLHSVQLYEF